MYGSECRIRQRKKHKNRVTVVEMIALRIMRSVNLRERMSNSVISSVRVWKRMGGVTRIEKEGFDHMERTVLAE